MAYNVTQEPYSRQPQPANEESSKFYLDDELRKIELTLDRLAQILEEIDARLSAGGL